MRLRAPFRCLFPPTLSLRPGQVFVIYGIIAALITTMLFFRAYIAPVVLSGLLHTASVFGVDSKAPNTDTSFPPPSDPLKTYTISANQISASFIPYGARLTSLLVPDRNGQQQDVVVGFDDPAGYVSDTLNAHSYIGCVVGRYANRIRNGTFEIDGRSYKVPRNELDGVQTLHGGEVGYDQRNWTVTSHSENSITFSLLDKAFEGFPGDVLTHATYSVNSSVAPGSNKPRTQLTTKTVSVALNKKTPIMLANHIYWNLNAFKRSDVLRDTSLHLPLSGRYVEVDSNLIPTGNLPKTGSSPGGTLDFTSPKLVGRDLGNAKGVCGPDCTGYDNAFIVDRKNRESDWSSSPETLEHVLSLSSQVTGIKMDVTTNQKALQIYTCNNQDGSLPVKPSQVSRNIQGRSAAEGPPVQSVNKYGCVVVETEGWIDGINVPEWNQENYQVFSPQTGPAINWATYVFDSE